MSKDVLKRSWSRTAMMVAGVMAVAIAPWLPIAYWIRSGAVRRASPSQTEIVQQPLDQPLGELLLRADMTTKNESVTHAVLGGPPLGEGEPSFLSATNRSEPAPLPSISAYPLRRTSVAEGSETSLAESRDIKSVAFPEVPVAAAETAPAAVLAAPFAMAAEEATIPPLPAAESKLPPREGMADREGMSPPLFSPLAAPSTSPSRSEQLEAIARQADRHTRHGFEMAGKRAYFAARAEFITALRLVAQGLDTHQQSNQHSRALAAALVALEEADDFFPTHGRLEADLDVGSIVSGHRTAVLKGATEGVTPLVALRCYLTFSQEQLAAAVGGEVAGSMALHALGKLHAALAEQRQLHILAAEAKAVAFFQAALLAAPENHMAANDLGVLLARAGEYPAARRMLEHSLTIASDPTCWHNLAVVYQRLGDTPRAAWAQQQAELARRGGTSAGQITTASGQTVRWVDPLTFARSAGELPTVGPGAEGMIERTAGGAQQPGDRGPRVPRPTPLFGPTIARRPAAPPPAPLSPTGGTIAPRPTPLEATTQAPFAATTPK